ncbi:MAG TPA: hypothetical protein DCP90_08440 [Clostridiales bacterium]|nr:MAG: hypothetical protein A2Y22_08320 [Clostridiales bacterium GWD2_32_59]HAN10621.1 hypothetical protein [Clostridiales bacterium]
MNKILSFIINNDNEFLLLRNNPLDPRHGGDFWYTVTGEFESYELDGSEVVKREIKEETNLDVENVLYLNWIFKYRNDEINCVEYVYIAFVNEGNIILNEENIDYKWCNLSEFVNVIKWYGSSKSELKKVLERGIEKKIYFKEEKIEKC